MREPNGAAPWLHRQGLPWLLIAAACGFLLFRAWFRARYFDGAPFDGPFQVLNPLDRLRAGQIPGRDFPLFHGLAILYAHYPLYALLGHNLFASEFARQLLSPIGWTAAMVMLAHAVTGSGRITLYALALFAALSCASSVEFTALPNPIVSQPGHSLIALRWAYPAACGAALIWACGSGTTSPARAAIAGALLGFAPCWSFEQGAFAVAAGFAVMTVCCLASASRRDGVIALGVFVVTLVSTTWLAFSVASVGDAQAPLRFAFVTIPRHQGWYFGAPPNRSIAANGASREVIIYLALVALLAVAFALSLLLLKQQPRVGRRLPLGIGFLGAFTLLSGSSLTGMLSVSYLSPGVNALMIAGVGIGYAFLRVRPQVHTVSAALVILLAGGALVLAYANELRSFRSVTQSLHAGETQPDISGVHPSGIYRSLMPLIERVRAVPGATVFSAYRGMLDIATDQPPYGRVDYIIHAFDDEEHGRYLRSFADDNFSFVHTIRPTYFGYEEWLQTSHWDFYRPLVERYAVVAASEFSLLWQRRVQPVPLEPHACGTLTRDGVGRWLIPAASSPVFIQLTADYAVNNASGSIPIVGGLPRYLLLHVGLANRLPVSLNPYHTRITWLVRSIANVPGAVAPKLYSPLPGAKLTVKSIVACRIEMPADVAPAFEHLQ